MALYKEFDSAVKKTRRDKTKKKLSVVGAGVTAVCAAATLFFITTKGNEPVDQLADTASPSATVQGLLGSTAPQHDLVADIDANTGSEIFDVRKNHYPGWKYVDNGDIKSTAVDASEYKKSSNGFYLPKLQLTCERLSYGVSFNVDEILGTDVAKIKFSSDLLRLVLIGSSIC